MTKMDDKDLSKLPRNAQMLQLSQMGRRKRVSRQDHDQRRTALENLTNRVLQTPRKVTKKDEVYTPEKRLQSVLQTPRKVAKMDKKNSQEEKLQSVIQSPPQTPLAKTPPSPEQQTPLAKIPPDTKTPSVTKTPPVKQKTPPTKQTPTNPKKRIRTTFTPRSWLKDFRTENLDGVNVNSTEINNSKISVSYHGSDKDSSVSVSVTNSHNNEVQNSSFKFNLLHSTLGSHLGN